MMLSDFALVTHDRGDVHLLLKAKGYGASLDYDVVLHLQEIQRQLKKFATVTTNVMYEAMEWGSERVSLVRSKSLPAEEVQSNAEKALNTKVTKKADATNRKRAPEVDPAVLANTHASASSVVPAVAVLDFKDSLPTGGNAAKISKVRRSNATVTADTGAPIDCSNFMDMEASCAGDDLEDLEDGEVVYRVVSAPLVSLGDAIRTLIFHCPAITDHGIATRIDQDDIGGGVIYLVPLVPLQFGEVFNNQDGNMQLDYTK
jgi:hypothetical protein